MIYFIQYLKKDVIIQFSFYQECPRPDLLKIEFLELKTKFIKTFNIF